MATLVNAVQNNSKLVAKLNSSICAHFTNIEKSLDTLINKYQELNTATVNAIDVASLKAVTSQINKAAGAFDEIGASIKEVHEKQKKLSDETSKGGKTSSIFSKIGKSDIFKKGKDELVEWIKSTDQYAAVRERLKAMGTEWLSSDSGVKVTNAINNALNMMANVIERVAGIALILASVIVDNWGWIAPIIFGIAGAILAYNAALFINNAWTDISKGIQLAAAFAKAIFTGATKAQTVATKDATIAQKGLNTVILNNPIMRIISIIIILIAIFYTVVGAINTFAGTSVSAAGLIAGAFAVLGAFVWNTIVGVINAIIQFLWTRFVEPWIGIIEWIINIFNGGFNSFGDAVMNLIGNIISWFLSLGKIVTKIIDAIFGTNWTDGLNSLQDNVLKWGKNDNAITIDRKTPTIDSRINYTNAWDAGYKWGQGIESKFDMTNYLGGLEGIKTGVDNTAGNTAAMRNTVDINEENLVYMRDIAEQEVVNRFATAEIKVDMTNHMAVNNDMDLDGVVAYLGERLNQEMQIAAEGVHI
jgi:hypothetical protein